ncbi:MAG: hypothetical protein IJV71_12130 [Lachnospiraceae bacterium]|nr:hypothetical protein [Lachnospiraceae bacterium]
MIYTADYLIQKRREKWSKTHDIEYDKRLRNAIAEELMTNNTLREEVKRYPEKLIELMFIVVDKDKKTMPFFLNEVQQEFLDILNKAIDDFNKGLITKISLIILKGRQQGFTTLITAYQLCCSILNHNFEGYTLADKSDNSEAIFQNKAKYPFSQLPDKMKPTEKFNNRKQLLFEKLNSSWAVDTATKEVGRSRTVNFFHGSECAFWKDGISPIQAALGEAFTKNCIMIYESTANGFNDYQKMWESGTHINCFFEWWRTKEYRLEFPSEDARNDFISFIGSKKEWIHERMLWLLNDKGLDVEQVYWYYKKWEGYLDKDKIKQEYPCDPQEAFLMSGKPVFDTQKLIARKQVLKEQKPLKTGYFTYEYDGRRITDIKWVNDRNGYIKIYQVPNSPVVTKYCIGGDTAGEGSDNFTAHVLDARTGIQVAAFENKFDEDLYTKQMYCLGRYYKWALIAIEANFSTYPNMELQRLGYPNMYVREDVDTYTSKPLKRLGFKTTQLTRPTILTALIEIVREHIDTINDLNTVEELLTIIRNEKGRIEAPEGGHDDHMMGLAIAHHSRTQVSWGEDEIIVEPPSSQLQFSDDDSYDDDDTITVI